MLARLWTVTTFTTHRHDSNTESNDNRTPRDIATPAGAAETRAVTGHTAVRPSRNVLKRAFPAILIGYGRYGDGNQSRSVALIA